MLSSSTTPIKSLQYECISKLGILRVWHLNAGKPYGTSTGRLKKLFARLSVSSCQMPWYLTHSSSSRPGTGNCVRRMEGHWRWGRLSSRSYIFKLLNKFALLKQLATSSPMSSFDEITYLDYLPLHPRMPHAKTIIDCSDNWHAGRIVEARKAQLLLNYICKQ